MTLDGGAAGLQRIRRRKSARDLLQKALYTVGLASSPLTQPRSQAEASLLQNAGTCVPPTPAAQGVVALGARKL